jgi:antitoxin component HigA of HigAB toxin-antitoxin module
MSIDTEASVGAPTDAYLDLIRAFSLRIIRTDEEHDRAIEVINRIADRKGRTLPGEHDYFLVLAMLIERYESETYGEPEEEPES